MSLEISRSLKSAIYDRMISPFYGAFLLSWLAFNWKIWVFLFFVSEENIPCPEDNPGCTKVDYILTNFNDWDVLLLWPLVSVAVIVLAVPAIANLAYIVQRWYLKWRYDLTNSIEKNLRLTSEDSFKLRQQLERQKTEYANVVAGLESQNENFKIQYKQAENRLKEADEAFQKSLKDLNSLKSENLKQERVIRGHSAAKDEAESMRRDALDEVEKLTTELNDAKMREEQYSSILEKMSVRDLNKEVKNSMNFLGNYAGNEEEIYQTLNRILDVLIAREDGVYNLYSELSHFSIEIVKSMWESGFLISDIERNSGKYFLGARGQILYSLLRKKRHKNPQVYE